MAHISTKSKNVHVDVLTELPRSTGTGCRRGLDACVHINFGQW